MRFGEQHHAGDAGRRRRAARRSPALSAAARSDGTARRPASARRSRRRRGRSSAAPRDRSSADASTRNRAGRRSGAGLASRRLSAPASRPKRLPKMERSLLPTGFPPMAAIVSPRKPSRTAVGRARRRKERRALRADGQRDPRAVDGRGAAGQLRPPRRADGHGRDRGRALGPAPAPQPAQPALARPRSLRALERPRLDAALFAAAPDRLRPGALRAAQLPPAAQQDARPSRSRASRPASRRPPARSARASPTRSAWRSPRSCSPPSSTAPGHAIVDHRTYVFFGDGCLMEGISHEACRAGRRLEARQADRALRRQRHLDRRRRRALVHRRHAEALRGLRLARDRRVSTATTSTPSMRRSPRRARPTGKPTLICCKTAIGKGAPTRAGTAKAHGEALGEGEVKATRAALGWPHAPFVLPDEVYAAWDAGEPAPRPRPSGAPDSTPSAGVSRARRRVHAAHRRRAAGALARARRGDRGRGAREGRDRGQPQGEPDGARGVHRRSCPSCSAAAPT